MFMYGIEWYGMYFWGKLNKDGGLNTLKINNYVFLGKNFSRGINFKNLNMPIFFIYFSL